LKRKPTDPVLYQDVKSMPAFCFACAKFLGAVEYLDMSFNYELHIPLCYECWKKTGMEYKSPQF